MIQTPWTFNFQSHFLQDPNFASFTQNYISWWGKNISEKEEILKGGIYLIFINKLYKHMVPHTKEILGYGQNTGQNHAWKSDIGWLKKRPDNFQVDESSWKIAFLLGYDCFDLL